VDAAASLAPHVDKGFVSAFYPGVYMTAGEQLLGFDVREMGLEVGRSWSRERKMTYMLRTDIDEPLSTDKLVWQPLWIGEESPNSTALKNSLGLWNDLVKLQEIIDTDGNAIRRSYWVIGVTLEWDNLSPSEQELWFPRLPETVPHVRNEAWSFLGYDIADLALLSGLSNCGYKPEEVESLRERWGKHLNRFHLFAEIPKAVAFKEISNQRIPEHAPFFVYGLYRIRSG
jgi:hypothetical protein